MTNLMWLFVVMGLCLGLTFFLSGMEAGVFALSRLHVRHQMHRGNQAARTLHQFLEDPEDFLWTILVGNTLSTVTFVSLIVYLLHRWLGHAPWALLLVLLTVVLLLYSLVDLLPKMLFRMAPNRLCLRAAAPFRLIHLALSPAVSLVAWLARALLHWTGGRRFTGRLFGNREELRLVMQESGKNLTSEERMMISRVLDLQSLTVGKLTVPMTQAVVVTSDTPIAEVFRLCREQSLTHLPVRERQSGRIAGVISLGTSLYAADLEAKKTAGDLLQSALFLDESARLEVALHRLQRTGQRLAIVLGRDGGEIGVLTLQDILRFIFGEVHL